MDKKEISFHYLKTSDYRTFHVDGAIGGSTPHGGLSITFFVERGVIPQMITFELKEDGSLGDELRRVAKDGVIRELECGVVMNMRTAKNIHDWLGKQIAKVDAKKAKLKESKEPQT